MSEILIVEDNDGLRDILREALTTEGYIVTTASSAEEGKDKLKESAYDLVITDLKLPEADGITMLEAAKTAAAGTEVIVMTAYGTVEKAVDAMKKGAVDFITKPFSIDYIRLQVARALKGKKIKEENTRLRGAAKREIIGSAPKIAEIRDMIGKIAGKDATILITGESGTGKEIVAETIHYSSPRRDWPLVKVNCAALAPGVLESELFGHEKGSFTDALYTKKGRFELAEKGTLFLDEIGDLPLALQIKLLRVLQEKEFERVGGEKTIKTDVRIIAATNKNLKDLVKQGKFREDLYYRLNVVELYMPALRERKEDIPELAEYFVKRYAEFGGFRVKGIKKDAMETLSSYDFPGNIRELENIIQRMLVTCSGEVIDVADVPGEISPKSEVRNPKSKAKKAKLETTVEEFEKKLISDALKKTKGNKLKAAEELGVNRTTLMSKLKKYKLD